MSSTRVNRSICCLCGKVPAVSLCNGCEKVFCEDHGEQHRKDLSDSLSQIIDDHNQCKQRLIEFNDQSVNHPLIQQIGEWEKRAIEKIRHVAGEARKQVFQVLVKFASNTMSNVSTLTEELMQAENQANFVESDLRKWIETLTKLKKQIEKPPTILIRKESSDVSFIPKLVVNVCEIFEASSGKLMIKDDGRLLVNYGPNAYGTARTQGDYSSGKHRFRFKVENCGKLKWHVIGIISKTVPIQTLGYNSPSSFGWISNNFVCLNGRLYADYQGYRSDVEKNDIVELFVDCQENLIRLTNERTNSTHELNIDPNQCPFPWQIQVCLYYSKDRIRLLWK